MKGEGKALGGLMEAFKNLVSDANTFSYIEGMRQRGFTREYAKRLEDAYKKIEAGEEGGKEAT